MTTFPVQAIFNRGELSPLLHSRIDLEYFRMSYKYGENFILTRHGGLMNRPGTKFLGTVKDETRQTRLVKFVFSRTQVYVIEFGHNYIRFWTLDGRVVSVSNPITGISKANPGVLTYSGADNFANSDKIFVSGVVGMTEVNSREFTVAGLNAGANTFQLSGVNTSGYTTYVSGGTVSKIYEIATTYTESELSEVQFAQNNDVIYIAHKNHAPAKLQRFSETNWVLSNVTFIDGPYLPTVDDTTSPASVTHSTVGAPTWSSVTRVSDASSASVLKDRLEDTEYQSNEVPTTLRFDLGVGNSAVLNNYIIVNNGNQENSPPVDHWTSSCPKSWEVYGSNDLVTFVRLDGRSYENGWERKEGRYYEFYNVNAYRYYEIRILDSPSGDQIRLNEVYFGYNGDYAPTTTLTFTGTSGINGGAGFTSDDIGRAVGLISSNDSKRRWFRITGVTNTTTITGRLYGYTFRQGWHISAWQLGAFSVASGYPSAVAFYLDRLVWARTTVRPLSIYLSQIGSYENHSVSTPLVDDDAISINIASRETEEILWLAEGVQDLVIGTSRAVRTMGKGDPGKPFSPSNFLVTKQTNNGSASVVPALVGSALIYPSYHLKALREFLYSFEVDSYVSPEVSILSDHLLKSQIMAMDYASAPEPILWVVNGDGELIGLTYDKENKVVGLHRSRIGGRTATNTAYAKVESLCIIPGTGQDDTWLVVNRQVGGVNHRYIERVTKYIDDTVPKEDAWLLDASIEYTGAAANVFTSVNHLIGATVSVFANNTVYENLVVSAGGTVTLPGGATAARALIGIPQSQYFELLQPVMETPDGLSFNRRKHSVQMILDLYRTKGLKVGNVRAPERVLYPENGSRTENPTELFTGHTKCRYDSRWDDDAGVRIVQDKPYPAFIRSVMLVNDGEP